MQGRAAFFEYLKEATQQYKRRLIIFKVRASDTECSMLTYSGLQTEDRFSVGVFLRGDIPWDDEVFHAPAGVNWHSPVI